VKKFVENVSKNLHSLEMPDAARYLVENFGMQTNEILKIAGTLDKSHPDLTLLKAQLFYCIRHEMICNAQDFFVRRTGLIYFDIHQVMKWKEEIVKECASFLGWESAKRSAELNELETLMSSQLNFQQI
jgi:glycerol-3-phosphate dehydrogenase